jgi:hypothetical protein
MKNEMQCNTLCLTAGSGTVAGFLALPESKAQPATRPPSVAEELRQARQEGIRAFAAEERVWLWITVSALAVLGFSLLS